jgi:hypothetical protein
VRVRRLPAASADPHEYLAGANAAFGQWGDESLFAWVFRDDAEVLFLDDGAGRAIAGAGIVYRTLRSGQCVAIMSGAWTLAAARGRGAFTRLVEEIVAAAAERHGFFLGFVRAENASASRLRSLGASMHPAFYCRSTHAAGPAIELDALDPDPDVFPSQFLYAPAQWRKQFLERPDANIACFGRRGEWSAVVESAGEFDRVHAVSDTAALPLLAARAHAAGRRLFWYTTRRPTIDCEWTDGFAAALPPSVIDWELQNGDRM